MMAVHHHHQRLGRQEQRFVEIRIRLGAGQADLDHTAVQHFQHPRPLGLPNLKGHLGHPLMKLPHELRQKQRSRRSDRSQPDRPREAAADLSNLPHCTVHHAENMLHPRVEAAARFCQADAAAAPLKELHPQPLFKALHLPGQCRLRDIEAQRRMTDIPFLHHRIEGLHIFNFHTRFASRPL